MFIFYRYKVIDNDGRELSGFIRAKTRLEAKDKLISYDYTPLSIRLEISYRKRISFEDLDLYCKKISSLLSAGIDISTTMEILEEEANNPILSLASKEVYKDIHRGESLSTAFGNTKLFPNILINMIRVGEETGEFDIVFFKMGEYFNQKHRVNNSLKKTMIYPSILLSFTLLVWIFLLSFIVPRFKEIFMSSNINLPLITRGIISLSDFILNINIMLVLIVIFGAVMAFSLCRDKLSNYIFNLRLKKLSHKSIFKKKIVLDILTPLSMMYKTAIPIVEIFENIEDLVESDYLKIKIEEIVVNLRRGGSISSGFRESELFPNMVLSSVAIGEESGSLDEILENMTEYYENDLIISIEKILILVEPILIILIGVVIGGIAIGLVIPIVDLMNSYI